MSEFSVQFDRLKQQGRKVLARVRPHHLAVLAGAAAIGLGVIVVGAMARPGAQAKADGARLQIEVVAPIEPEVRPGSVMEVGHLVNGLVSVPRPQPAAETDEYSPYDEPAEAARPVSGEKRYTEDAVIETPAKPEAPTGGGRGGRVSRWLGFDGPERDYRAEREARRARRDAQAQREEEARQVRRYRSDGPTDGSSEYRRRDQEHAPRDD